MCDPQKFTARYLEVLTERLGLSATASDTGDIVLDLEEHLTLRVFNTAPGDPEILRLFAVFGVDVPLRILESAIAVVNGRVIGVKLFAISDHQFVAEAQMVVAVRDSLPTADHLSAVLPRVISMVLYALEALRTELTLHGIADATESAA